MKENEEKIKKSLTLIEQWVSEGMTYKEIAEKLQIPYSTFRRYSEHFDALKNVIAQGKEKKNQNVVAALYKCCIGYSYYEEVPTKVKTEKTNKDGTTEIIEDVKLSKVKKYKGPDLQAQKYWLNNRDKARWNDDPSRAINDKKLTKIKVDESKLRAKIIEGK